MINIWYIIELPLFSLTDNDAIQIIYIWENTKKEMGVNDVTNLTGLISLTNKWRKLSHQQIIMTKSTNATISNSLSQVGTHKFIKPSLE